MNWSRVVGHDGIIRSFDAAWRKGRLGHAYLFVGPAGVGKHTLGRELARALLCESPGEHLRACGECAGCKLADGGSHPDLFLAARPEDKVEFPIEVVRELIEHLSLKPARGNRKIAILDDADDLNDVTANAFLKTLEEPPEGSILILVGGPTPERQFATIRSRCQIVPFTALRPALMAELLERHEITDPARRDRLVRVAGGSIGQALAFSDDTLWDFRQFLLQSLSTAAIDPFALVQRWGESLEAAGKEAGARRRRASLVLHLFVGVLQDGIRVQMGVPPVIADAAETVLLEQLGSSVGPDKLMEWVDRAVEADLQVGRMLQVDLVVEAFADALVR